MSIKPFGLSIEFATDNDEFGAMQRVCHDLKKARDYHLDMMSRITFKQATGEPLNAEEQQYYDTFIKGAGDECWEDD